MVVCGCVCVLNHMLLCNILCTNVFHGPGVVVNSNLCMNLFAVVWWCVLWTMCYCVFNGTVLFVAC